jgi:hypothetical protein
MQGNPIADWQNLTEHYRTLCDEELLELAADLVDLTETAKEVLRNEMKNRGLREPQVKADPQIKAEPQTSGEARKQPDAPPRFAGSVEPDHGDLQANDADGNYDEDAPREYTWKTPLCECETTDQARQLHEVLKRAGIDSWVERPGTRWASSVPRVVVAADQLEEAVEIAGRPIPQDILDQSREDLPEFEPPKCPKCGAEDPVLEAVDPVNTWQCEACGKQWTEPAEDVEGETDQAVP